MEYGTSFICSDCRWDASVYDTRSQHCHSFTVFRLRRHAGGFQCNNYRDSPYSPISLTDLVLKNRDIIKKKT